MTRQAARKVIDGLERREYARTQRDARDTRRLNVILTPAGRSYAQTVTAVIYALNREFCEGADPARLAAADAVLRAVVRADSALDKVASLIQPPG